ncbi:MAG: hypothetical protein V5B38_23540 [Candidatus Accumulibacter propinquus]
MSVPLVKRLHLYALPITIEQRHFNDRGFDQHLPASALLITRSRNSCTFSCCREVARTVITPAFRIGNHRCRFPEGHAF